MLDGHVNKCIDCNKKDVHEHRAKNIDRINAYDKKRYYEHGARLSEKYLKSHERKESHKKANEKWSIKYPYKKKCASMVATALGNGSLIKEPCIICSNKNSHGHHYDYNKPLDVVWLCNKHHKELHTRLVFNEDEKRYYEK